MAKRLRKVGSILLDLERVLDELLDHDLQWGDILYLVFGHLRIHRPDAREEYVEGGNPEFFYEHREAILQKLLDEEGLS